MDTMERIEARTKAMGGHRDLSPDFPLAILAARGRIDREMYEAGMRFGALYCRVFGAPQAKGPSWARWLAEEGEPAETAPRLESEREDRERLAEAEYRRALAALDAIPLARQLVHHYAVHLGRDWYIADVAARHDQAARHGKRLGILHRALTALANLDPVRLTQLGDNPLGVRHKHEPAPAL